MLHLLLLPVLVLGFADRRCEIPSWLEGPLYSAAGIPRSEAGPQRELGCADLWAAKWLSLDEPPPELAPLAQARSLEKLSIDRFGAVPLDALRGLPIRELRIGDLGTIPPKEMPPLDLGPLRELANLEALEVGGTVRSLEPLRGLTRLKVLRIGRLAQADLAALAGLDLQELCLEDGDVRDLSALAGMANLERLCLNSNPVSDLSALAGLPGLRTLELVRTGVTSLEPLRGLGALERLDLRLSPVKDPAPVLGLPALRVLQLCGSGADWSVTDAEKRAARERGLTIYSGVGCNH